MRGLKPEAVVGAQADWQVDKMLSDLTTGSAQTGVFFDSVSGDPSTDVDDKEVTPITLMEPVTTSLSFSYSAPCQGPGYTRCCSGQPGSEGDRVAIAQPAAPTCVHRLLRRRR